MDEFTSPVHDANWLRRVDVGTAELEEIMLAIDPSFAMPAYQRELIKLVESMIDRKEEGNLSRSIGRARKAKRWIVGIETATSVSFLNGREQESST